MQDPRCGLCEDFYATMEPHYPKRRPPTNTIGCDHRTGSPVTVMCLWVYPEVLWFDVILRPLNWHRRTPIIYEQQLGQLPRASNYVRMASLEK